MNPRLLLPALACCLLPALAPAARQPNVIYLMADELGYFEPSFAGNPNIRTPQLDRMAAEGMRFTRLLAGSAVCAPTRCCFLTGKHSGHTSVRSNGGGTPLRAGEATIASVLKAKGYATGGFGKWGCGGRDSTGVPEKHGFDVFLGYYDQVHAHSYYPPYLVRNSEEVPLPGNLGGSKGTTYSHYVIWKAGMDFIRENKDRPFFCYLPVTPPHGIFDIPDKDPAWAIYRDKPWPEQARRYAAMVTMLDRQLGEMLAMLRELGLEQDTVVFFSGDNGGADYFASPGQPKGVHGANRNPATGVVFRGHKGNLYEGGLRIPFVARWPGHIAPGQVSDHLGYFPDVLPTIAEIAGASAPADIDGISFLPTLLGDKAPAPQRQHEFLYWEIGGQTAVRQGGWKAFQQGPGKPWELYQLDSDPSESRDLAAAKPEMLEKLKALAGKAHEPAREGTFSRTDRHERDRRAKFGQQDQVPAAKAKPAARKARAARGATTAPQTLKPDGLLPRDGWRLLRTSSENAANGRLAACAIDGDPSTLWHTAFAGGIAKPPHELLIDLGAGRTIRGFRYLARQDQGWNGAIKEIEFRVGMDPAAPGEPVARATLAKTRESQDIPCPAPAKGRYVLLRALSEVNGGPWASAAEIGVVGE